MQTEVNEDQQELAINSYKTQGTYLVLAGPGTGKTYTISHRLKAMIESGIKQDKILCLTFSDTAANEMRSKTETALNTDKLDVKISTYHSFCLDIIQTYPFEFEMNENIKIATDSVKRAFVRECLDDMRFSGIKFFKTSKEDPYYYIPEIIKDIEEIKKYRMDRRKFFNNIKNNPNWALLLKQMIEELKNKKEEGKTDTKTLEGKIENLKKRICKMVELWKIYELYEDKMQKKNFIDFSDMINTVLDKFEENPVFLADIAQQYEYILVDEYQDTNKSQNEILFALAQHCKNIFVVGDDEQIIYTFQGARITTLKNFLNKFPDTKVICLTKNYRSNHDILNLSRLIIKKDINRLEASEYKEKFNIDKLLIAQNQYEGDIKYNIFPNTKKEAAYIINEIKNILDKKKCSKKDIAILTTTNKELYEYAKLLEGQEIEYELKEGKSIFDIKSSSVMFYYMQFLLNPILYSDKLFRLLLMKPFSFNETDYDILYKNKGQFSDLISNIKSIIENGNCIIRENYNGEEERYYLKEPSKLYKFLVTFNELKYSLQTKNLRNIIIDIGNKTGIFNYYINENIVNRLENIAALNKLVEEAEAISDIDKPCDFSHFVDYLQRAADNGMEIKIDKPDIENDAIQLTTYFSSKGKEYEYVFMPNLINTKYESKTGKQGSIKPDIPYDCGDDISVFVDHNTHNARCLDKDEEINGVKTPNYARILFVGVTRAKHTLYMSYPEKDFKGKVLKPTDLISLIKDKDEETGKEISRFKKEENSYKSDEGQNKLLITKCELSYNDNFPQLIKKYLENPNLCFSPTALNTYINCPRQFLYSYILKLKSNSDNADNMHFGTAIHKVYEKTIQYIKDTGCIPKYDDFENMFLDKLNCLDISTYNAKQDLIKRGRKALVKIYDKLKNDTAKIENLKSSETEKVINIKIDNYKFSGKIDRIDKCENGVILYDYKTGGEKTINKDGDNSNYYNQMAIYKYALEHPEQEKDKMEVKETTFIFPEYENNYTKTVTINEQDCQEILDKYKQAIKNMENCKFDPKEECNLDDKNNHCPYKKGFCCLNII